MAQILVLRCFVTVSLLHSYTFSGKNGNTKLIHLRNFNFKRLKSAVQFPHFCRKFAMLFLPWWKWDFAVGIFYTVHIRFCFIVAVNNPMVVSFLDFKITSFAIFRFLYSYFTFSPFFLFVHLCFVFFFCWCFWFFIFALMGSRIWWHLTAHGREGFSRRMRPAPGRTHSYFAAPQRGLAESTWMGHVLWKSSVIVPPPIPYSLCDMRRVPEGNNTQNGGTGFWLSLPIISRLGRFVLHEIIFFWIRQIKKALLQKTAGPRATRDTLVCAPSSALLCNHQIPVDKIQEIPWVL